MSDPQRVELTDGQHAMLRPVSNGGRRRAWAAIVDQVDGVAQDIVFYNALLADCVEAWSLPHPLPAEDPTVMDDQVSVDDANILYGEMKKQLPTMFPDFTMSKENVEDRASPSGASSD